MEQQLHTPAPLMDADAVRAYVAAKFPGVLQSPLRQAMHAASAMALLEASDADAVALRGEAMAHAEDCLAACDGWTVETLGHNIESVFGMDLDSEECDEIARAALSRTGATEAASEARIASGDGQ